MKAILNFLNDERGSMGGEYMVITASITVGTIGSVKALSDQSNEQFGKLADGIDIEVTETPGGDG